MNKLREALKRIHMAMPCYKDDHLVRRRDGFSVVPMRRDTAAELWDGGYLAVDGKTRNVIITPRGWSLIDGKEHRKKARAYYRQRRDRGEVQVTVWIREEDRAALSEFVRSLSMR